MAEKQFKCSICHKRFKSKSAVERHNSSWHIRRHSWSCSALVRYTQAFHDSVNYPGEADTCGYCGNEFPRSGQYLDASILCRHATDQDWEKRIQHLHEVHKFQECNLSKKFFRADHFRQHLKHSHSGTRKWTTMLENACMLEQDPSPG